MKRPGGWMERLAEGMDLNGETLPGMPLVEICGEGRVLIEQHCGVSRYGSEQICVRVKYGEVEILGCGMELAKMSKEQLVVLGRIDSVRLVRRRGR